MLKFKTGHFYMANSKGVIDTNMAESDEEFDDKYGPLYVRCTKHNKNSVTFRPVILNNPKYNELWLDHCYYLANYRYADEKTVKTAAIYNYNGDEAADIVFEYPDGRYLRIRISSMSGDITFNEN